jgi:hypothetical protein
LARRRELYLTTHETLAIDIHASSGIQTHNPSKRSLVDPRHFVILTWEHIRVRVILFRNSRNLFFAFEEQDYVPYHHKPTDKITIMNIPLNIVLGGFV